MEHRERELKLDVPDGWQLPDPALLVPKGGHLDQAVVELENTYYDTVDRDLLRAGTTLRRRRGGPDEGWHLKLPAGEARTEIAEPLTNGRAVPAALRDATRGLRLGAAVAPIAILRTQRQITRVCDAAAQCRYEIVVDQVHATQLGATATVQQWREVEVELVDGTEKQLARAARWLTENGAAPSSSRSKLAHTLGVPPPAPRDLNRLAGVIGRYLDEQYEAIIGGDVALRRGARVIHPTRVGTRRYRSVLRVFGSVLDPERARALEEELRWYGMVLGAVRDRQVLRGHLDEQVAQLPPERLLGPVAARIDSRLAAEEADAQRELTAAMRSKRYYALLTELRAWRDDLPIAVDRPASAVGKFLAKAEQKVQQRWSAVPDGEGRDAALHRVRKAAKRARYTAELAEPVLGRAARRAVEEHKHTQTKLGDRQDEVVAADFLYRTALAAAADGENTFSYGLLFERNASAPVAISRP